MIVQTIINNMKSRNLLSLLLACTLVAASSMALSGCRQPNTSRITATQTESRLDRIKRTGVLRIGYGGYPPYLTKGAQPGEVSGYSVDMITRIIEIWKRDIRIEWVETSWDRVKADFLQDKFDLVVEPLFRTIARASELDFTRPYTYSGYGVPVVRADEQRFSKIEDFDKPDLTLAVTQSASSHDFVARVLPKAKLQVLPTGNLEQPLMATMLGQADAAFADVPTVTRFLKAHQGKVKALFYDDPPVLVGAGFMLPQGDYTWASFLNTAIDFLETSGELKALANKYDVPYYSTLPKLQK
jgi:ABC-type amino acid transport substrate-binding protein